MATERLLDLLDLEDKTKISGDTITRMASRGEFPKPLKIGRSIRWREAAVDDWIAAQAEAQATAEVEPRRKRARV